MKRKTCFIAIVVSLILSISIFAYAIEKTQTGFYWPIGVANFDTGNGWWMSKAPDYFSNYYHIGVDMMTSGNVYAISNGIIYYKSTDGWGTGNCALLIKHRTVDGSEFIALYGHIRTNLSKNDSVLAGQTIGVIGPWNYGEHLHFGIHPGPDLPYSNSSNGIGWGRMTVNHYPDTNGFVNPIDFLNSHAPYINFSDDSHPIEVTARQDGEAAWYPPNVDCFDAEVWFRVTNTTCLFADRNICYEITGTCPALP